MKNCRTCRNRLSCFYRGINAPCDSWEPDNTIIQYRRQAKKIVNSPMTMVEHQFVQHCCYATTFSPRQEAWLSSIIRRIKATTYSEK